MRAERYPSRIYVINPPGYTTQIGDEEETNLRHTMAKGGVGKVGIFDETLESWESYTERIDMFFIANGIKPEVKVASFLSMIGPKTYGLLKNLLAPVKPADKGYDDIIALLDRHLNPKPSEIAERFRFHKREQRPGEDVMNYVAELRKLSVHCNFGDTLQVTIRDRFVCGLRQEAIQRKLLAETTLTLDTAITTAVAMETAGKDAVELQRSHNDKETPVNKLKAIQGGNKRDHGKNSNRTKGGKSASSKRYKACFRCDSPDHDPGTCRFISTVCRYCSKKGHIEKACLSKKREHKSVKYFKESSDPDPDMEPLFHINKLENGKCDPILLQPKIEGKTIEMELDTGSAVTLIPHSIYKELFCHVPLHETTIRLKSYAGENIMPLGVIRVRVSINNQDATKDLLVVPQEGPALFGRDWLRTFQVDWHEIKMVRSLSTQAELKNILDEHKAIFSEGIGKLKGIKGSITLEENAQPKFHKARLVPYSLKPKVEAELQRLEQQGIITPVKHSKWAAPIVPVVKKSGQVRVCGDFKVTLNPVMKVEQYPLPRIEDIFSSLAGGQRFSKVDLTQAYLQMEMEDSSKELLTINTHQGLFQYNRLPFGVASAPALWQRAMDQVLQKIPFTSCILDDMIISGRTDEEHLQNLRFVLQRLQEYGLKANLEKCEFFQEKLMYCGHVISQEGLQKSPEKVDAVLKAPKPENLQQLRSFLGLVNYYRRFLPDLSTIEGPLNELLHSDTPWKWTVECEKSFGEIKKLITSDHILCHYDPGLPIKLACDASPYGLGCVISHTMKDGTERPIAFASRSLTKAEKGYSQIDKEALGLFWGVQKFNTYLYGRHFTLVTDHKPLVQILHPHKALPAMTAARLQRYAVFLSEHSYDIEYKNTTKHCNADALSRLPLENESDGTPDPVDLFYTSQIETLPVTSAQIRHETSRDSTLSLVHDMLMSGTHHDSKKIDDGNSALIPYIHRQDELSVHQGCVVWGNRVVIPSSLQERVLSELHDGHPGVVRMKAVARSYVWWPTIDKHIEQLCSACLGCQQSGHMPKSAPVHPWEWPSTPWQRVHVDFAGPFMNSMFLIVIDAHSKWPEVFPMRSTTTTLTIDLLRDLFARHGIPQQLVSDNGPQFVSEEFRLFMKQNGIRHSTSSPYHPRTNGQAERFVQTFKQAMKNAKGEKRSLQQKLSVFLCKYRSTPHAMTNETPAKLLLGRNLRTRLDIMKPDLLSRVSYGQDRMKLSRHTGETVRKFSKGHHVMVRDYRSSDRKWIPAAIHAQTGPLSYTIDTGTGTLWRRHTDQLRACSVNPSETVTCVNLPEPEVSSTRPEVAPPSQSAVTAAISDGKEEVIPMMTPTPKCKQPNIPRSSPCIAPRRYPKRENLRAPVKLNL